MPLILVTDEQDDVAGPRFVNSLHTVRSGRAVLHAPPGADAFYDELLASLGRDDRQVLTTHGPRRRLFAEAWLLAYQPFDLIVYGAWRLAEREIWWLFGLSRAPYLAVWLITHPTPLSNRTMTHAGDRRISFAEFRREWSNPESVVAMKSPPRGQRSASRVQPPDLRSAPAPWPWGLAHVLGQSDEEAGWRCVDAANALVDDLPHDLTTQPTVLGVAAEIRRLFLAWSSPADRAFGLIVLRDALFRHQLWLEWAPELPQIIVVPELYRLPDDSVRIQEPSIAADRVLAQLSGNIAASADDALIAPGADSVVLASGQRLAVPPEARAPIRAHLYLRHHPEFDKQVHARERRWMWTHGPRCGANGPEARQRASELSDISEMVDVRWLRRSYVMEEGMRAYLAGDACHLDAEPTELGFHHALLLADTREFTWRVGRQASYAPLIRWRGDVGVLTELGQLGLVTPRTPRLPYPELVSWLGELWLERRVDPRALHRALAKRPQKIEV